MFSFTRHKVSPDLLAKRAAEASGHLESLVSGTLTALVNQPVGGACEDGECQAALEAFHSSWVNDVFVAAQAYGTLVNNVAGAAGGYGRADATAMQR